MSSRTVTNGFCNSSKVGAVKSARNVNLAYEKYMLFVRVNKTDGKSQES